MFGDPFAPARQLLTILQGIVGPTREMNDVRLASAQGQWVHQGRYRDRPLRIVISHRRFNRSVGSLAGVSLGASFGGRPIELAMNFAPPGETAMLLPNQEGALFPHGLATGFPTDVARAALDPATVAALDAATGASGLSLQTEGGWLSVFVRVKGGPSGFAPPMMPEPAELVRMLDFVFGLADRLVGAFDHAHAEAYRAGGPAAAAQWLAAQHEALRQRAETKGRGTMVAVVVAVLIMTVVIVIVIGIVVFASRC